MRTLAVLSILLSLAGCAAEAAPKAPQPYKAPRTSFGAPDLQGIWTNSSLTFLIRPPNMKNLIATEAEETAMLAGFKQFAGDLLSNAPIDPNSPAPPVVKDAPQADWIEMDMALARIDGQRRSSWIVEPADGKIPFTEAGLKAARGSSRNSFDGPEGRPATERCVLAVGNPEGPPMMNTGFNAHYQIIQTKDHVAIEVEMNHDVRIIRLTDRAHAPEAIRFWMGDSVGWWEGDTLVVETTNMRPGNGVSGLTGGFVYSRKSKLIERFTRTGKNDILYAFSVEDPDYFKQTWRAEMPMRASRGPIYEYACHEGNYSLPNALTGARAEEARAAALAAVESAALGQ